MTIGSTYAPSSSKLSEPARSLPGARSPRLVLVAWGLFGLLVQFGPVLLDGSYFELSAGLEDFALLALQSEHQRHVLLGEAPEFSLLQAPYFFPFPYSAALTELMLLLAPIFLILRGAGLSIFEAQVGLSMLHSLFSYLLGVALLRQLGSSTSAFRLGFGGFLIAFSGQKTWQLVHPHLLAQEFWLLALLAIARTVRRLELRPWLLGYLALLGALQLWLSVQVALMAGLLVLSWIVCALLIPTERKFLAATFRIGWQRALVGSVLGVALLLPIGAVFLEVGEQVTPLNAETRSKLLPPFWAPLIPAPLNPFEESISRLLEPRSFDFDWEHRLGLGAAATILTLVGLPAAWKHPGWRSAWLGLLVAWLTVCRAPGLGDLWVDLSTSIPGFSLLRAPGRIWLLATPLLAATALLGWDWLSQHGRRAWLTIPLFVFAILEQAWLPTNRSRHNCDLEALLTRELPAPCDAFFFRAEFADLDRKQRCRRLVAVAAMQRAIESQIPTLNGYSGYPPKGWELRPTQPFDSLLHDRISQWLARFGESREVCVMEFKPNREEPFRVHVLPRDERPLHPRALNP